MKNRSLARFVVFALIQVVLCVLAFVFAAGISSAEPEFQTDGSIYVDGTDFTPLAQLGGEILNGALSLLALGASFLVTAVISPLRRGGFLLSLLERLFHTFDRFDGLALGIDSDFSLHGCFADLSGDIRRG